MDRMAYVDNQMLARQFKTGDLVRKTDNIDTFALPYVGRVICSNPQTGIIDVQWPWGAEQAQPMELMIDISNELKGPEFVDDYSSYDKSSILNSPLASKIASRYASCINKCYACTCKALHYGAGREEAQRVFDRLAVDLAPDTRDRIHTAIFGTSRHALYYKSSPRKYQMTRREEMQRAASCPKCKSMMRPAKVSKNAHVFRCSNMECKFMIHPEDVMKRSYINPSL